MLYTLWKRVRGGETSEIPQPEMQPRQPEPQKRAWRWSNNPHSGIPDCHRVPGEPPVSRPAVWRGPNDDGGVETNPFTGRPVGKWMDSRRS
jgi:hypothetical protein